LHEAFNISCCVLPILTAVVQTSAILAGLLPAVMDACPVLAAMIQPTQQQQPSLGAASCAVLLAAQSLHFWVALKETASALKLSPLPAQSVPPIAQLAMAVLRTCPASGLQNIIIISSSSSGGGDAAVVTGEAQALLLHLQQLKAAATAEQLQQAVAPCMCGVRSTVVHASLYQPASINYLQQLLASRTEAVADLVLLMFV
jgi:hypothetical protein